MSGPYENLPFLRGATYGTTDTTLANQYEGKEFIHEDRTYGTGKFVKVRVVRNNSGAVLLGKRAAKFALVAGAVSDSQVSGYATVTAERSYIIDDLLPATGVPNGDLFFVVLEGPCLARTSMIGADANAFAVGDYLHAQTAVTTGATTSGRVGAALLTGATSVLAGNILNIVGRAMSAKTTANTNADVLIDAGRF